MLDTSVLAAKIIGRRSFRMTARATVTRGGEVLAADIPIADGFEEADDTLRVPERVTISVPRVVDGVDWSPQDPTDPLAPYGQRLHVKLGIDLGADGTEWLDRGEFLIYESGLSADEKTVDVTAVGLLELVDESGLVTPFTPGSTFAASLRKLVEPALTVALHPDVDTSGTVPSTLNFDDDRLGAMLDILEAWPARAQVTPSGYLYVTPADYYPTGPTVQRYNFDTEDGVGQRFANVVHVSGSMTRDGIYNVVVARGQAADGGQVTGIAYDRSSPTAYQGVFNRLPVPYYYFSPLLDTAAKANKAAASTLARVARPQPRRWEMVCSPDPRILLNDLVPYRALRSTAVEDEIPCVVEKLRMPYTAGSGPMQLTLREVEQ